MNWIKTDGTLPPPKPGLQRYEQIPCVVYKKGDNWPRILVWNCEHLCWDDEDGDDFNCSWNDVDVYFIIPKR